jgi:hypothetical protein
MKNEALARSFGFSKVSEEKKAVARSIKEFVLSWTSSTPLVGSGLGLK